MQKNWDCWIWKARLVQEWLDVGGLVACTLQLLDPLDPWPPIGSTGQYLYEEVRKMSKYEVVFVWNRSEDKMRGVVPEELILRDLADCASR